ncbi:MAG: hypothetical protein Q9167_002490 [Letrouitia subvulpina]
MAKDKSRDKEDKKREKKSKEKRSKTDGVKKPKREKEEKPAEIGGVKKVKKEKKEKHAEAYGVEQIKKEKHLKRAKADEVKKVKREEPEKREEADEVKKIKKETREKRAEADAVEKTAKEKKHKKGKKGTAGEIADDHDIALVKAVKDTDVTAKLLKTLEENQPGSVATKTDGQLEVKVKTAPLLGALVPFANPLADEKLERRVLKGIKKAAKVKALKRGVKEVVKALRKSPNPSSSSQPKLPMAIVVFAGDVSPMDVISHLPVLCEDKHVPYVFVPSRHKLGEACLAKRPTSVVMVGKEKGKRAAEGDEPWGDTYKHLVKYVKRAGATVKI